MGKVLIVLFALAACSSATFDQLLKKGKGGGGGGGLNELFDLSGLLGGLFGGGGGGGGGPPPRPRPVYGPPPPRPVYGPPPPRPVYGPPPAPVYGPPPPVPVILTVIRKKPSSSSSSSSSRRQRPPPGRRPVYGPPPRPVYSAPPPPPPPVSPPPTQPVLKSVYQYPSCRLNNSQPNSPVFPDHSFQDSSVQPAVSLVIVHYEKLIFFRKRMHFMRFVSIGSDTTTNVHAASPLGLTTLKETKTNNVASLKLKSFADFRVRSKEVEQCRLLYGPPPRPLPPPPPPAPAYGPPSYSPPAPIYIYGPPSYSPPAPIYNPPPPAPIFQSSPPAPVPAPQYGPPPSAPAPQYGPPPPVHAPEYIPPPPPQHYNPAPAITVVEAPRVEYLPPEQIQQLPLQDTNVNFHGLSSSAVASGSVTAGGDSDGYHYGIGRGTGH
ncbi:uncharacterized protein LOC128732410 [Sabethes cyaneus]|uniref:uncharacterized protein LOC128732410 n=1 Tax=Sabethes cyaneus TaxID=53552 RepID=UPI00237E8255|nr:uncharacterized protein LOC128732410 [Sabethes cyaneus]